MQSSPSFAGFAAGVLVCVMSLAAVPAHAQRATPEQLTAYRMVASDGLCATVDATPHHHGVSYDMTASPCSDTNNRQLFYILALGSDVDYVWQTQPPGAPAPARIALADTFDNPSQAMYSYVTDYLDVASVNVGNAGGNPGPQSQWLLKQVPKVSTWTPVAVSGQLRYFGIAGWRTLQYRTPDGQALYRTVQGIDSGINGYGLCNDAFFGGSLPGPTKSCLVQGADRRDTPIQVQIFNLAQPAECIAHVTGDNDLHLGGAACAYPAGSPTISTVWSLVPAKYPQ